MISNAYIGPILLLGSSYLDQRGEPQLAPIGVAVSAGVEEEMQLLNIAKTLTECECHVEGLTHSVGDTRVNDIPMLLQ